MGLNNPKINASIDFKYNIMKYFRKKLINF